MYRINLLPNELRPGNGVNRHRTLIVGLIILLTFVIAGLFCGFVYRFHDVQKKIDGLEMEINDIALEVQNVEVLTSERKQIETMVDQMEKLISGGQTWSSLLKEIYFSVPQRVWLTRLKINSGHPFEAREQEMSMDKGESTIVIIEGKSYEMESLGDFLTHLNSIEYFNRVLLVNATVNNDESEISFIINAYTEGVTSELYPFES